MNSRAARAALAVLLAATVAGLAAIGLAAWNGLRRPAPREPTPVELRVAAWRAAGLSPNGSAEAHVAAGREALRADHPERDLEARRHFAEALALDATRLDALAGWLDAAAACAGEEPEPDEVREAHRLAAWALERAPQRADLLTAWTRVLLLSPGAGRGEALAAAQKAVAAGGGAEARLAEAQARLETDPRGAADAALEAQGQAPADRRPLAWAARARWQAGEPRAALELLDRRLAEEPGHGPTLARKARLEAAVGRTDAARATLRRWQAAAPASAEPLLLQAQLAWQLEGDLGEARRLLARARTLGGPEALLARVLAHAAAVERALGNPLAARRFVAQAVARAPFSAPARFQEAQLAFARGDVAAHRRAAGAVGARAGLLAARVLEARTEELIGHADDAVAAWEALATQAPRDLALQLQAAAALARLKAAARIAPVLARAGGLDPASARARRRLGDFDEGPPALAAASRDLQALAGEEGLAGPALAAAATAELLLGQPAAAEALASRASLLTPAAARPRVIAAQSFLDRGRTAEALRELAMALDAEPSNAVALEVRARALETSLRLAEAAEARRQALAADPGLTSARLGEARRLLRDGAREKALQALRQLRTDEPDDAAVRAALLEAEGGARR